MESKGSSFMELEGDFQVFDQIDLVGSLEVRARTRLFAQALIKRP